VTYRTGLRVLLAVGLLASGAACKKSAGTLAASPSAVVSSPASVSPTPSASVTPAASPTAKPTVKPTVKPTPKPTPKPSATPFGPVLGTAGAYLKPSEDENLTSPDPENGCAVHDPDLVDVTCGVVTMPGGIATWIVGREDHNRPGESEPRLDIKLYRRLGNGSDSLVYWGISGPEQWAAAEVKVGALTGQARDSLVFVVTFRGSGTLAGYDIVTWRAGTASPVLKAHHGEGSHAQTYVRSSGYISTYEADYSDGAPNCCPHSWQHDNVRWDGAGHFRIRHLANVASPPDH
jgi:hypothetical protein